MSQINFEDDTLDASDGVTKLLLAAEYWKAKAVALRAELDALKRLEPVGEWRLWRDTPRLIVKWKGGYKPEIGDKIYAHPIHAQSVPDVTDDMVLSFHHALTDAPIGQHEVDEIKIGLRAALAAAPEAKP